MAARVSVVIPSHNRRASLERAVAALAAQSYPPDQIEVLVVADGTESTAIPAPLTGRVIAQPGGGPAAARNRGAATAAGDLLVFIDDDVEPSRDLVAAHFRAHLAAAGPAIVVGYLPPKLQRRRDLFGIALRGWWEAMFERMRTPGHRFAYSDVLSGNCSMPASLFRAIGGFDERLRCHEDYELGYRALGAGARIRFAADAGGWHDERTDLHRALGRKRHEGIADIALARKHPELWPSLPCGNDLRPLSRRERVLRTLALTQPSAGDAVAFASAKTLGVLEYVGDRARWHATLDRLLWYWYWRGVADALDGASFADFRRAIVLQAPAEAVLLEIDLEPGLEAAEREIDRRRPRGAILRYGPVRVGTIPVQPWAEPLAGRHLRHLLKTTYADRLAQAIGIVNALDASRSACHPLGFVDDGPAA